jgi:hypothetical protein
MGFVSIRNVKVFFLPVRFYKKTVVMSIIFFHADGKTVSEIEILNSDLISDQFFYSVLYLERVTKLGEVF